MPRKSSTVPTQSAAAGHRFPRISPFKAVDAPVIQYLSDDEMRRLVNAAP
jgi:hypothetical protein